MLTTVELFKLDTYKGFKKRIKSIDPRERWKFFKKLVQAEVRRDIIKREF